MENILPFPNKYVIIHELFSCIHIALLVFKMSVMSFRTQIPLKANYFIFIYKPVQDERAALLNMMFPYF